MFGFFKKQKITLLTEDWKEFKTKIYVSNIPRIDEYLYFKDEGYLKVLNVVHSQMKKNINILIIVKPVNNVSKTN